MYRKIFIIIIAFIFIFNIYSQNNLGDPYYNEKIIGSIIFEGLKVTNPNYLLSKISIKEGYVWNEIIKEQVKQELLKISSIVEELEIVSIEKENNIVDIKITILEKSAFLLLPYATYSNSRGLMPKIIFRHYNLGGYRKYLNSKIEFIPKESLNVLLLFRDPEANFNKNISYEIRSEFKTSILNYSVQGLKPIGVLDDTEVEPNDKWNNELFVQGILGVQLTYKVPYNDIEITPILNFNYKRILFLNKDNYGHLPVDIINPGIGLNLIFPIKSIKSFIKPSFYLDYRYTLGDAYSSSLIELHYYRNIYDRFTPQVRFAFSYLIPKLEATLEPYIKLIFQLNNSYYYPNESLDNLIITDTWYDDYLDLILGVNFNKSFTYWKITHRFNIVTEFEQRLYGYTTISKQYANEDGVTFYNTNKYPYNFKSKLEFTYEFDYNIYKSHHFKMKYLLFTTYNDLKKLNTYIMGVSPGKFEGFAGLIANIKYELPLFDVDTPKFVSFSIKRPLRWKVFWDFYLDIGLALTDIEDYGKSYTVFDRNFLHLYPAAALGTAIRVLPKFAPLQIVLKVGADIYGIFKERSISGSNILFEFSIDDIF